MADPRIVKSEVRCALGYLKPFDSASSYGLSLEVLTVRCPLITPTIAHVFNLPIQTE